MYAVFQLTVYGIKRNTKVRIRKKKVKNISYRGQPGGTALKCTCSASRGPGFATSDPGCGHGTARQKPCCGRRPMYKVEEDGHGC